jgi:hypothetical protein
MVSRNSIVFGLCVNNEEVGREKVLFIILVISIAASSFYPVYERFTGSCLYYVGG